MDVKEWLRKLGLEQYEPAFCAHHINFDLLPSLTARDLEELGVRSVGHRRKLLDAIRALADKAGPDARGEAQRRQITVLFCDLVGSTELSTRLDPEDFRKVIADYHARAAEVIGRHTGVVARYMGDGLLAYFGYPSAHEDDAEQAVRAGLVLVEAFPGSDAREMPLQLRVGIATGTVVVGDLLGEGAAQEEAAVGAAPNLAARLQALAHPNTVVISDSTRRLTGELFEYRQLGPIDLKGWPDPVPAWQVLGASRAVSRFEAHHTTNLLPLIGREEELELLDRRWRQAKNGDGRVVVLTGEPGIGKSHVALAFQKRLQPERPIKLRCFCSAHHTNSVLFPFITQIEQAAGFERNDSPAQKLAKFEKLVAQAAVETRSTLALLADLLSLPGGERFRLPDLSPQKRKEKTLAALLTQLDLLAARRPVLMIFEDVHWIDPTSAELLALIVERAPRLRILLLITARPEFVPSWPAHAHVTTVPLTRLSRREAAALIERVTAGKKLPLEVLEQILARTDGVPLFIEELTKTVLESGMLKEEDGRYVLERPLPALAIPTTLHASLTARLDRLAPVREVAQIGAALGREFSYELLSIVSGLSRERLEEALGQLVRAELLFCRGEIPQAVYTFKHTLVRDAAYSGLLKSRRIQLHAAIASAFEQQFPEIVETEPEALAHHLSEAGLVEKAARYWLQAGKNAALRSANIEALAHLQRGLECVEHCPEGPARHRLELDLRLALGPCLIATQGPASATAMATFARARALCERLGDPPEYLHVMFWHTTASVVRGELLQAEEAIGVLLRSAQARADRPALLNALRGHAMILLFMGRIVEARAAIERALEAFNTSDEADRLAARAAGQDAGVAGRALMSWALWPLGYADRAVEQVNTALARARAIRHPHTEAYACYYGSVLHALRHEPGVAHALAERCVSLSEEHGFKQWRGLSRAVRGICSSLLQCSTGSLNDVRSALDEYCAAGYQLGTTALYVLLCPALLLNGEYDSALEVLEQGLAKVSNNPERLFEAELYRLKARTLLALNGSDALSLAPPLLDRALTASRRQSARLLELRAARDLAALWIAQGKRAEARNLLAPVYASFSEGFETHDLREAKALLDQLQ
jgi:class 3 adenylate cyclase/predicted ATPase